MVENTLIVGDVIVASPSPFGGRYISFHSGCHSFCLTCLPGQIFSGFPGTLAFPWSQIKSLLPAISSVQKGSRLNKARPYKTRTKRLTVWDLFRSRSPRITVSLRSNHRTSAVVIVKDRKGWVTWQYTLKIQPTSPLDDISYTATFLLKKGKYLLCYQRQGANKAYTQLGHLP